MRQPLFIVIIMIGCYILFSEKQNRYHVGANKKELIKEYRVITHMVMENILNIATTNDWELFLFIESKDYSQAIRIERHIKKMKSKTFILNLIKYPEIVDMLKNS